MPYGYGKSYGYFAGGLSIGSSLSISVQSAYLDMLANYPKNIGGTISFADTEDAGGNYTVTITVASGKTLTASGWTGTGTSTISRTGTLATLLASINDLAELVLGVDVAGESDGTATIVRDADGLEASATFGVGVMAPLDGSALNNNIASGTNIDTLTSMSGAVDQIINYSATLDEVSPALSNPTDTKTGSTTATLTVSTTKAEGDLYWVSANGGQPSEAQIRNGQDSNGDPATLSGTAVVSATGVQTIDLIGLSANTAYPPVYFVHDDDHGNTSNIVSGDGFTTDPAVTFTPLDTFDGTSAGSTGTEKGLWLDETDLNELYQLINATTPVTTAGQLIGANTDKSGNGNTGVAPANDTTRPTYVSGGGAQFTRSPITRLTATLAADITGKVLHVFAVVRAPAGENNNARYVSLSDTAFGDDFFNANYAIPIQYTSAAQFSAYRGLTALSVRAAADDTYHLVESLWDATNHTLTVDTVDGTPVADTRDFAFDLIGIGAPPAGKGNDSCMGIIKEVYLIDRNTALTTDRASLRTYWNDKHSIY